MHYPHVKEIIYQDPPSVFAVFAKQQGSIFLDSAKQSDCGRYSFIAVDPFLKLMSKNDGNSSIPNPFSKLEENLKKYSLLSYSGLPPFQGGAAGYFSYDLVHHLEKIPNVQEDDMQFHDMWIGFYDLVIAFDHELQRAWIFSSGFPEFDLPSRMTRAIQRCEWILNEVERAKKLNPVKNIVTKIQSNFSRAAYCQAVQKVKDYILAGDIFQANISQRFSTELNCDPFKLYINLRERNPACFSAYLLLDDAIIASASPERFLKLTQGHVETRPIKGTRPRGKTIEKDYELAQELLKSEKDHAENTMIVDLLRNDLSRVCEDHSVQVPQLCGLESYPSVHHLVSIVTGQLKKNFNAIDLLRATFPGGSITGAPKIRAMEIIAEIEPTKRGPYCGCIGYIGFNGDMDTSITIRTYAIKNNIVTFQAGGGIVMDSDPEAEYAETLTKAQALRRALYDSADR